MHNHITVTPENGVTIRYNGMRIAIDPKRPSDADFTFISHAHIDHIGGSTSNGATITSEETAVLAERRGFKVKPVRKPPSDIRLVDSGHILGSRGILIDGDVFYTGDFSSRPRAFLNGGETVECNTLILETTFGKSEYRFPPIAETLHRANQMISSLFSRGIPVVLMGHPLGKAQILSYLFSSWDPVYLHQAVLNMNEVYLELGVDLRRDFKPYSDASKNGRLERRPWILISPLKSGRSPFIRSLKKKYGAVTMAFTGWSADPRFKYMMNLDYALPISDHCDFDDLVKLVKKCRPQHIYTVHGFSSEFAAHLRSIGFDAKPLVGGQRSITEYLGDE